MQRRESLINRGGGGGGGGGLPHEEDPRREEEARGERPLSVQPRGQVIMYGAPAGLVSAVFKQWLLQ